MARFRAEGPTATTALSNSATGVGGVSGAFAWDTTIDQDLVFTAKWQTANAGNIVRLNQWTLLPLA